MSDLPAFPGEERPGDGDAKIGLLRGWKCGGGRGPTAIPSSE